MSLRVVFCFVFCLAVKFILFQMISNDYILFRRILITILVSDYIAVCRTKNLKCSEPNEILVLIIQFYNEFARLGLGRRPRAWALGQLGGVAVALPPRRPPRGPPPWCFRRLLTRAVSSAPRRATGDEPRGSDGFAERTACLTRPSALDFSRRDPGPDGLAFFRTDAVLSYERI